MKTSPGRKIHLAALLAAVVWTVVVGSLLSHAVGNSRSHADKVALAQARTFFQQVVDMRSWNASHGGVYVEVTGEVRPNPYLDVPERDIETTSGRKLTLINPAYMTRQVAERGLREHGVRIHITSLKPIRPANSPAVWEEEALRSFEEGAKEFARFTSEPQGETFRYMAPLAVEESCLRCHSRQGYRVGDIRGGISVTVPENALARARASRNKENVLAALVIWLAGLGVIAVTVALFAEKQKMVDRLQELSLEDPLTGLKNRRGFLTLGAQELEIAKRWGKTALLLFVDVDYLKDINDNFGHAEGDEALGAVARVLKSTFRQADVTARLGGDEFAVFCMDASAARAATILEHFKDRLERESESAGKGYRLSVSVGSAEYRAGSDADLAKLMAQADADMYEKKRGRRRSITAS